MSARSQQPEDGSEDFLDALLSTAFAEDPELELADSRAARAKTPERPTIVGPYAVLDQLGAGGVATVWRVFDGELERELAVKLLRPELRGHAEMERRLEEEARISSRLDHPAIVSVHARGRTEDGRPYFAMRLVEGQTLSELFAASSDNAARARLEVLEQVAYALAHAHQRRIVHGDVKPQNIMVGAFGEVQLMDWGFAFELDGEREPNALRRVGGTPAYMSPEQARGERAAISPRTDVFGLGAMLCELLTGYPPYRGSTKREVVAQATLPALDDAYARLAASGAAAPLIELTQRCLHADPEQRPADAGEVAHAIGSHLAAVETRARDLQIEAASANARAEQERRARRLSYMLAITLVLISVGASLAWILWSNARAERDRRTSEEFAAFFERAETLYEQAKLDPLGEHDLWKLAIAAAHEADTWLRARESSEGERAKAASLLSRVEADRATAVQEIDIRERILALRAEMVDEGHLAAAEQRYQALFAELGLHVDAKDLQELEATRAAIEASPLRLHLIQMLDAWTNMRRRTGLPSPDAWRRTLELSRSVDVDPLRESLRAAYADSDVERFLTLLQEANDLSRFPARSHDLIASCLRELGRPKEAIEFLRRAMVAYPGDANLAHSLSSFLGSEPEAPLEEMERLLWMAHAVRPRDAHLVCDLARVLILRKRNDEAITLIENAAGVKEADPRAKLFLGTALIERGEVEAGEALLAESAHEGMPLSAIALAQRYGVRGCNECGAYFIELAARSGAKPRDIEYVRAGIYYDGRDYARSAAAAVRAIAFEPQNEGLRALLIHCLVESGKLEEASQAIADWRLLEPKSEAVIASLDAFSLEIANLPVLLQRLDDEGLGVANGDPSEQFKLGILAQRFGRYELAHEFFSAATADLGDERPPHWYSEPARTIWSLALAEKDNPARAKELRQAALRDLSIELEVIREEGTAPRESIGNRLRTILSTLAMDPHWESARDGSAFDDPEERAAWRAFYEELTNELNARGCSKH